MSIDLMNGENEFLWSIAPCRFLDPENGEQARKWRVSFCILQENFQSDFVGLHLALFFEADYFIVALISPVFPIDLAVCNNLGG